MGTWSFGYDQLNRLTTAQNTALPPASTPSVPTPSWGEYFCWAYDSFGNRTAQQNSNAVFASGAGTCSTDGTLYQNIWMTFNSQNQTATTNAAEIGTLYYDAAGDVGGFGNNQDALYDAEGRICEIFSPSTGWIAYVYDAAGNRVAKGTATVGWSCDISTNGFQQTEEYFVGPGGEQLTEFNGSNQWKHTNVYAAGKLIATQDADGFHYHIDDSQDAGFCLWS